jgi:methylglutaconyl-CoA hydratase
MAAVTMTVLYERANSVARITLNRPDKRNALNDELIDNLKNALREADRDDHVRVVILSSAGRDFCAGADLSALQEISTASVSENLADARSLMELFTLIRQVRVPVIATVRGRALAGGCGLALACDIVLAESSACFGFPEIRIGFVPAMVMAILRRNLSEKKAFELIAFGAEISAAEAAALGIINRVFESSDFDSEVHLLAERLTKLSPSALSLSKNLLYKTDGLSFLEALESGVDVNVIARMSEDCRLGIKRFLEEC